MTLLLFILMLVLFIVLNKRNQELISKVRRLESDITAIKNHLQPLKSRSSNPVQSQPINTESSQKPTEKVQPSKRTNGAAAIPAHAHPPSSATAATSRPRVHNDQGQAKVPANPGKPIVPKTQAVDGSASQSYTDTAKQSEWRDRWRTFLSTVDWEQFTGVKLFAWLGGLALFIAAGFFVKFSIDRNLIPPTLRLAICAITGIGLIISSGRFKAEKFEVMRHTLAACGIGVLYSVVFAATLYYDYLTRLTGFGMLSLISMAAFALAVYHRGIAISVLGAVGAYATPLLVTTGYNHLVTLVIYLTIVNTGLYLVAQRLVSHGLLWVATAGTLITLSISTWGVFFETAPLVIAGTWLANFALFIAFLWFSKVKPEKSIPVRWTGVLVNLWTLAMAAVLMTKPGWSPLLMVTVILAGGLCLAWRRQGWHTHIIPYLSLNFMTALAWMLLGFDTSRFSVSFILLLIYGALGGLGPVLLVWRHGVHKSMLSWFRIYPLAIVAICMSLLFVESTISFWFWPLLLGLALMGVLVSLVFSAYIQVILLIACLLIGVLNWVFELPADMLGIGFFAFVMAAGIVLSLTIFGILRKLPDLMTMLKGDRKEGSIQTPDSQIPAVSSPFVAQWLAAAPAAGVSVLLAVSFLIFYPHYPHPGMATVTCFLVLVLFAVHRLRFEIPGAVALLSATAAQNILVNQAIYQPQYLMATCLWSGALFVAALVGPFFFSLDRWKGLWSAWALFEVIQGIYFLFTYQSVWTGPAAQWMPLALTLLKLPIVAILLRRLDGHPHRNTILAFHGGTLIFYFSCLPVLVLDHGWIGLTLVFEATALLWLNRRIAHPGLRWVALGMSPIGLLILFFNLPLLKTVDSLTVLNPAVLSTAAGLAATYAAVAMAGYPQRRLGPIDLPAWFQWLAVLTGFLLINLVVADLFAAPGERFNVWPENNFLQSVCYALSWVCLGGLMWKKRHLPPAFRFVGLGLISLGGAWLTILPVMLSQTVAQMPPLFNLGLVAYLPLLGILLYLLYKVPEMDIGFSGKNIMRSLLLAAGFMTLTLELSTVFDAGYPFSLLVSHTPANAAASAAGWLLYGLGVLIWPRLLDRPFRLAGIFLLLLGVIKTLMLPFQFREAFAHMVPIFNAPSLVFLIILCVMAYLTLRRWGRDWPMPQIKPRVFWGVALALTSFAVLNIEIASAFAIKGSPFSMLTHGSLSMQLAYSIGWLVYASGLLAVGIKWQIVEVRWAAIIAIVLTATKIFIRDLWSLGQLYRVGSLLGLAVVLIMVSFLYQRFLSKGKQHAS